MTAAEWLDKNEWPNKNIDSDAFSHYTTMSKIMEQYAREYHVIKLEESRKKEETQFNQYL